MDAIADDEFHTCQRAISPVISSQRLLRVVLWSILLAAATYTTTDPDLWGHVRFGLDMLGGAGVPSPDIYSFTSDRPWINHEWLAEIVMAGAFRMGGDVYLILLKLITVGGTLLLLDSALRRDQVRSAMVRDTAAAVALVLTIEQTQHVRPQLFSVVCFAGLMWCLTASRRGTYRALFLVPPLFAVWANLHGGWLVGGGVLALWTIAAVSAGAGQQTAWNVAIGLTSLCATLLTPYHVHLWSFLRDTVAFSRADIVEWQPVYALGWIASIRWAVTAGLGAVGLLLSTRREGARARGTCLVALAAASLMVARLEAFFALAVLFLVGPDIGRACEHFRTARRDDARTAVPIGVIGLTVAAIAALLIVTNINALRVDPQLTPEPGAVRFLQQQPPGRLLVWFDWGEYAIWHLGPRMRVSIDGRRETAYSAALQEQHLRFYFDAPGGSTLPSDIAADYVWIPRTVPAAQRLDSEGWARVYEDGQSVVFGHAIAVRSRPSVVLAATTDTTRVFPGP